MIANWLVSMKTTLLFLYWRAKLPRNKQVTGNMWVRMFFMSICGYSCCSLTVLLPPLCFSQAQRNKAKQDISPVCVCVQIYTPGWISLWFMSFWSSPEKPSKAYDVPLLIFFTCIYLLNLHYSAGPAVQQVEATSSASSGNDGDQWQHLFFLQL